MKMGIRMINVGIIGVGTVGQSVAQILEANKEIISARAGSEIKVVKGVVSNLSKKRDVNIPLSDDLNDILEDDSIDVVVELMGGVDNANEVVKKALANKKAVVTANKALLAYHRYELQELAGETAFEFEAAEEFGKCLGELEQLCCCCTFVEKLHCSSSLKSLILCKSH